MFSLYVQGEDNERAITHLSLFNILETITISNLESMATIWNQWIPMPYNYAY